MNEGLPDEMQRYLSEMERDDPDRASQLQHQAKLATGISQPEILSPDERALLEHIRQHEPDKFQELQMIAEFANEPVAVRPHCSRLVPFAHAVTGFVVAAILLWWLGADRRWVCYLAALPTLYGLWNLKSALFDSQETLDRNLRGDGK